MALAILHGGPGGNTTMQLDSEPSEVQFQQVEIVTAVTHNLPAQKIVKHPAPQPTTQTEKVIVTIYHKVHKIVPDGNLHYLYDVDYKNLVGNRGF